MLRETNGGLHQGVTVEINAWKMSFERHDSQIAELNRRLGGVDLAEDALAQRAQATAM